MRAWIGVVRLHVSCGTGARFAATCDIPLITASTDRRIASTRANTKGRCTSSLRAARLVGAALLRIAPVDAAPRGRRRPPGGGRPPRTSRRSRRRPAARSSRRTRTGSSLRHIVAFGNHPCAPLRQRSTITPGSMRPAGMRSAAGRGFERPVGQLGARGRRSTNASSVRAQGIRERRKRARQQDVVVVERLHETARGAAPGRGCA